jgi:hypothetical protein
MTNPDRMMYLWSDEIDTTKLLSIPSQNRIKAMKVIAGELEENPRVTLTKLSQVTHMPVSTVFDLLQDLLKHYKLKGVFVEKPM